MSYKINDTVVINDDREVVNVNGIEEPNSTGMFMDTDSTNPVNFTRLSGRLLVNDASTFAGYTRSHQVGGVNTNDGTGSFLSGNYTASASHPDEGVTLSNYLAGVSTTTSAALTTSADTSIAVTSTTDFPTSGYVRIESEIVAYTGVTATSLTGTTRGYNPVTGATDANLRVAHASGAVVHPVELGTRWAGYEANAVFASVRNEGNVASLSASQVTSDSQSYGKVNLVRHAFNGHGQAWASYTEATRDSISDGYGAVWAEEYSIVNYASDPGTQKVNPYSNGYAGHSKGIMVNSGADEPHANPADVAYQVRAPFLDPDDGQTRGSRFYSGLVVDADSLVKNSSDGGTSTATGKAVMLGEEHAVTWSDSTADDTDPAIAQELFMDGDTNAVVINRTNAPGSTPALLDFRVGGTSKAYFQAATGGINIAGGNLGIGTTSPSQALDVNGNAIVNGSIGIGTTSLGDSKLRIQESGTFAEMSDYAAVIQTYGNATGLNGSRSGLYVQAGFNRGVDIARFSSIGSGYVDVPRMTIGDNGDFNLYNSDGSSSALTWDASASALGIGTTSPTSGYKLDVDGAAIVSGQFAVDTDTLYVRADTDRVGINTSAPSQALDVVGSAVVEGNLWLPATSNEGRHIEVGSNRTGTNYGYAYIDLIGDSTYSDYGLRIMRGNTGPDTYSVIGHKGTGNLIIRTEQAGKIQFDTTGSTRAVITADGKLGVGTASPSADLHVNGIGRITTRVDTARVQQFVSTSGLSLYGGAGNGANIELYGGSHASLANNAYYDAAVHTFRSVDAAAERFKITSTLTTAYTPLLASGGLEVATGSWSSTGLKLTGAAPSIYFSQDDTGSNAFAGVNGDVFFILRDADSNGLHEGSPYPLELKFVSQELSVYGDKVVVEGSSPTLTALTIGTGVTLSESTDRPDLLSISSSTTGWGGLQITNSAGDGIWSFMVDSSYAGLYDDQNNEWILLATENAGVNLRYNGSDRVVTTSAGVDVTGNISVTGTVDGVDIAGSINQDVRTTASPTFNSPTVASLAVGTGAPMRLSKYDSGDTDITGLIAGSNFGGLIETVTTGHLAVGILGNGPTDGFHIISTDDSDEVYDTLVASFLADGSVGIGTNTPAAGLHLYTTSGASSIFDRSTDGSHVLFRVGGASAGNITTTSLSTTYASTSDYRAKENVVELAGASDTLMTLRPVMFNMIGYDQSMTGFIAHEVAEVVPEAVVGEKDAVDENGDPIYQGIDQSKLVPLLTAALQEALGRIEALEAKLNK